MIGHDVWESRFFGDPGVIGSHMRLGAETATIVGVMPEGFRFLRDQQVWVPVRAVGSGLTSLRQSEDEETI